MLQYIGHSGSVNSISFNPTSTDSDDLMVVTASGDQSAHMWKASVSLPPAMNQAIPSSEDELEPMSEKEDADGAVRFLQFRLTVSYADLDQLVTVRQPMLRLTGHNGVVIAADWLSGGDQIITASWDRTANIYDAEKGEILNILSGSVA